MSPSHSVGEDLSDRLDVVEADVEEIREGVTDVIAGVADVAAGLQRVEEVIGGGGAGGEALAWIDTATSSEWEDLISWVDRLWWTYELPGVLPSCWPAHLGIVEELSALHRAWRQCAKTNTRDNDAMAYWHDRLFEPTLRRLASNSMYPNLQKCAKTGEHRTPDRVRAADRSAVSIAPVSESDPAWRAAGVDLAARSDAQDDRR